MYNVFHSTVATSQGAYSRSQGKLLADSSSRTSKQNADPGIKKPVKKKYEETYVSEVSCTSS